MKNLCYEFARITVTLLCFLSLIPAQAATYYFSSSQGNDSYSSSQAQNPSTPWRSLAKLNAFFSSLNAGDVVLFKRGDTFEGTIIATKSGYAGNPITFSAYGSGNRPVISGFGSVGSWTNIGNGVWEAAFSSETASLNLVTINEVAQAMGRYPNSTAANKGYLTIDNAYGSSSITDNQLSSYPNWSGAEVVIRKNRWIIDRNKVTSHSGSTINYSTASSYTASKGYGYFIQNHPSTLDSFGEWYYNKASQKLQVYFGSNSPSSYRVKASRKETGVRFDRNGYLKFDNLAFEGFNFRTFDVEYTTDIFVTNCAISFSGGEAIGGMNTKNFTLENSTIDYALNNGVGLSWQCPGATIRNNQIKNVGYIAGMGQSGNFTYQGVVAVGDNPLIENNTILNNGYVPLTFCGNNSIVRKNYIENFCNIKDDGGAIYTWNNLANASTLYGQKVTDNIVMRGAGAPEGTANPDLYLVKGIYMDDNTANVEITRNTVTGCTYGMYIHNSRNLNIYNNTFFDNREYQVKYEHDKVAPDKPIRNVVFKNNVLVANTPDQGLMNLITKDNDISQFGTFESNYYTRAIKGSVDAVTTISGRYTSSQVITTYNLPKWKTVFGFESGSVENTPVPHYKVNQLIGSNKFPNKSFDSNINGIMKLSASGNLRADWDNTNKLSGGSLRLSFAQVADQKAIGQAATVVGNIDESKKYLLKFSFISANIDRTVKVILMNNTSPYQTIERKSFKSSGKRIEHEFLIEPSSSLAQASLRFEIAETDGTVWIDNIELYEADVAIDPDHVRLEYNTGNTSKTISFNGITYVNGRGEIKSGNLNLESFASEVLIKQSGELNIVSPLEIKIGSKPILCYGQSSGSALVSATGGVPPYRYQWSNGATTPALEKLPAGSYTVTVTDGAGSSKTASLSLTQAAALTLQQTLSPETSRGRDGAISLAVAGGTGSYSYLWSTGATTKDLTGLAAGDYQVTLTDANGCQLSKTFTLARTPAAPLRLSLTARPPACQGASNGSIQASVSGGVPPYSYRWSSGAASPELTGIAAGRYSLTLTDAQGTQTAAELTLQQPQALLIQEQLLAESPAGGDGSIRLSVSGGTAPYSYRWSSGATTQDLFGIAAGSYQVRVTDAQGCYQERTFFLEQTPAAALLLSYRFTPPRCFGSASGSIRLSVSGGVPPYRYQWSSGATTSELTGIAAGSYQVNITDAQGSQQSQTILLPEATPLQISYSATAQSLPQEDGSIRLSVSGGTGPYSYLWSSGATTQNLSGLIAGSYGVSVTDAYGCQVHETIQVKQTSGQTATTPLTLTLSSQALRCYGQPEGAVDVAVTGGVPPYRYQWSNGATTPELSSLPAGSYTVTVTDGAGSSKTASLALSQPQALQLSGQVSVASAQSSDGSIRLSVSGGTPPYRYEWSTGATTQDLSGLAAGSYQVSVTDQNGCRQQTGFELSSLPPLARIQSISLLNAENDQVLAAYHPLQEQDMINLALLPSRLLNLRANTSQGAIERVEFVLNGAASRDLTAPFYLQGPAGWRPEVGAYQLIAIPYTKGGQKGESYQLSFSVIDQPPVAKGKGIEPLLGCVQDNGDGTLTATLGYVNYNPSRVELPRGKANFLSLPVLQGELPESFEAGTHAKVFTLRFAASDKPEWKLTGPDGRQHSLELSSRSSLCSPQGEPLKPRIVFSPNQDGIDDLWQIDHIEQYPGYELLIYNRQGSKVFEAKPYQNNWDGTFQGKPLMAEAYYFVIKSSKETIKSGTVTIIR